MVEINSIDPFSAHFGIVENISIFHPQIFPGDARWNQALKPMSVKAKHPERK